MQIPGEIAGGTNVYVLVADELQETVGDGIVPLELLGNDIQLGTAGRAVLEELRKNLELRRTFSILLDHDYSTEVTGYSQGAHGVNKVLILMDEALYADRFNGELAR